MYEAFMLCHTPRKMNMTAMVGLLAQEGNRKPNVSKSNALTANHKPLNLLEHLNAIHKPNSIIKIMHCSLPNQIKRNR